ncbi:hypothetical protein OV450_5973 [Actinobacteria bacterium OV450]|nr:hypothetical protein OV450_5973 [Actinobacteria bacterium OV450]
MKQEGVRSGQSGVEGAAVVEVGVAHVRPEAAQRIGGGRSGPAGERADAVAGGQQVAGGGPALSPGGSGDGDGEHGSPRDHCICVTHCLRHTEDYALSLRRAVILSGDAAPEPSGRQVARRGAAPKETSKRSHQMVTLL